MVVEDDGGREVCVESPKDELALSGGREEERGRVVDSDMREEEEREASWVGLKADGET